MSRHADTFIYRFKGFVRGTYTSTRNYEKDYLRQIFHEIYMTRDEDDVLMHRMIPVFKGSMINEDMVGRWKENILFNYRFTRVDLDEVGSDPAIEVVIPPPVANIEGHIRPDFFVAYPPTNVVAPQKATRVLRVPEGVHKVDYSLLSAYIAFNPVFWLWIFIQHGFDSIDPFFLLLVIIPMPFIFKAPSFRVWRFELVLQNGVEKEFKTQYRNFVIIELVCFSMVFVLYQYALSLVMVVVFSIQLVRLTTRFFSRPGEIALLMSLALNPLLWRLLTSVVGGGLAWFFSYPTALFYAKIHHKVGYPGKKIAAVLVMLEAFSSIGFTFFLWDLTVVSLVLSAPLLAASMLLVLEPGWKTGLAAVAVSFCTHPVLWYYIGLKDILLLLGMMVISVACLQVGNTLCPRGFRLRNGLGLASLLNAFFYLMNATSQMMGLLMIVPIAISMSLFANAHDVEVTRSPPKKDSGRSEEIPYRSP